MTASENNFEKLINEKRGVVLYFATNSCSVGEALEPKVRSLLIEKFPKLIFYFVDMNAEPEFSAKHQVFVEPTILLFIDGKEFLRKSRHIGVGELELAVERLYQLAFED
jgi:thioredoxin 1